MNRSERNIRKAKQILLVCFALLALSPCIVKETVYGLVAEEYQKPLNKSRTTVQTVSCQFFQHGSETSISKEQKVIAEIDFSSFVSLPIFNIPQPRFTGSDSKTFTGNSPPKYILYKRLKLDIA